MKPEYLLKKEKVAVSMSASEYEVVRLAFKVAQRLEGYHERLEELSADDRRQFKRALVGYRQARVIEVSADAADYLKDALVGVNNRFVSASFAEASHMAQQLGDFALHLRFQLTLLGELPPEFGETPTDQA